MIPLPMPLNDLEAFLDPYLVIYYKSASRGPSAVANFLFYHFVTITLTARSFKTP